MVFRCLRSPPSGPLLVHCLAPGSPRLPPLHSTLPLPWLRHTPHTIPHSLASLAGRSGFHSIAALVFPFRPCSVQRASSLFMCAAGGRPAASGLYPQYCRGSLARSSGCTLPPASTAVMVFVWPKFSCNKYCSITKDNLVSFSPGRPTKTHARPLRVTVWCFVLRTASPSLWAARRGRRDYKRAFRLFKIVPALGFGCDAFSNCISFYYHNGHLLTLSYKLLLLIYQPFKREKKEGKIWRPGRS
jgi:hypothetical protein